jgi:hypothetical protein
LTRSTGQGTIRQDQEREKNRDRIICPSPPEIVSALAEADFIYTPSFPPMSPEIKGARVKFSFLRFNFTLVPFILSLFIVPSPDERDKCLTEKILKKTRKFSVRH